ncbi:MAG: leukotoxin LktA family filamentous adhesin, partial [Pseudooceanicola atlanticus]
MTADGRTQTNVAGSGATTNVTTQTISQGHGVNSFSSFNVGAGQTVNMHVPQGAAGTVNIINGSQSQINGVVQSMQGGAVGGNLYMANPQGFVVGPQGVVRGGSVSMTTPSQGFVDGMFNSGGVSGSHVGRIIGGTAPLGPGNIDVYGRIDAGNHVGLRAGGQVRVDGVISAGEIINGGQGSVYIEGNR